jgi:hypothetical protein
MNDESGSRFAVPETAGRMAAAAAGFVSALTTAQRQVTCVEFGDDAGS